MTTGSRTAAVQATYLGPMLLYPQCHAYAQAEIMSCIVKISVANSGAHLVEHDGVPYSEIQGKSTFIVQPAEPSRPHHQHALAVLSLDKQAAVGP